MFYHKYRNCLLDNLKARIRKGLGLCLYTCMVIVYHCLDDILGGEVDEGKVTQFMVGLHMAGDYINRRLPASSTESTVNVFPVRRAVCCESKRCF